MQTNSRTGPLPWLPFAGWRPLRWLLGIVLTLVVAWTTLSMVYGPLPWPRVRMVLALVFALFALWALWRAPGRRPILLLGVLLLAWGVLWASIRPSHDREWRPEVAVMPRVEIDGDRILVRGYRNFEYRGVDDFTVRHEDREYRLSKLAALDFYVSYWQEGPVAHTYVAFLFEDAEPLVVSIETRPEVGEGFDPIASLFKAFELIYVVGDDRDITRVRTNHRHEQVFLYHTNLSRDAVRELFLVYAERINELADEPEFYHLLSNSCTINIVRYANRIGRTGMVDIRHVLNGWSDRYMYRNGFVDTSMPFDRLRARSNINAAANAAGDDPAFPERIRDGLPVPAPRAR